MQFKTEEKRRQELKAELRRKLPFLVAFGTDDDIIASAKKVDPKVSEQTLKRIVKLFHDAKLAHAQNQRQR